MAENSKIEWTHHTANLWWGCEEVHEGCDNCYARVFANRFTDNLWGANSVRREIKSVWNIRILVLAFPNPLGYQCVVTINGKPFYKLEQLANNDGLTLEDFIHWMYNKKEEAFEGQIICWDENIEYQ